MLHSFPLFLSQDPSELKHSDTNSDEEEDYKEEASDPNPIFLDTVRGIGQLLRAISQVHNNNNNNLI